MRDEFEQELKQNLSRVAVPKGFADGVMKRIAKKENLRFRIMPQRGLQVWHAAIAAMVLIGVLFGAAGLAHRQQERRKAEIVRQQFDVAMRVTGRTLDEVGELIDQAGVKREER